MALGPFLSRVSRKCNDSEDETSPYIVNAGLTVLVKIQGNASAGPFLVGLEDLITMDYSKSLITPNPWAYSVSGLSGMDGFRKHSLVGFSIREGGLPILLFFGWSVVGLPVRMRINNINSSHGPGAMGPHSWPVS